MQEQFRDRYISNKKSYLDLALIHSEQLGGAKETKSKFFIENMFLNKEYFDSHHKLKYRKRRLFDFDKIAKKLKNNLIPKNKTEVDEKLLKKYIKSYKKKNTHLINSIMNNLQYVTFSEFNKQLKYQISRFNTYIKDNDIKKYVFTLGVGNDGGFSSSDYNLYKSNLWVFLLIYKHLKIKPYDIVLNLNIGMRIHYPDVCDFLIVDDCSYSGSQLIDSVMKNAIPELLYKHDDAYKIVEKAQPMYETVLDKQCNVHLVIPYLSSRANSKINDFEITCGFRIIKYVSKIIKTYGEILDEPTIKIIDKLYKKFYNFVNFAELVPIFFQHKIADMISTIDLILIKGQVLDNPKKKLVFIKECVYDKNDPKKYDLNPKQDNFIHKKLYCPSPPYLQFKEILSS